MVKYIEEEEFVELYNGEWNWPLTWPGHTLRAVGAQHKGQDGYALVHALSWALKYEVNESYILVIDA